MFSRVLTSSIPAVAAAALGATVLAVPAVAQPTAFEAAESFAVLARTAVSNTGVSSIGGDVGAGLGGRVSGFPPGTVIDDADIHEGDAVGVQALMGARAAAIEMAARTCPAANNLTGLNLGGRSLAPGVYCFNGDARLTGTLTLSGAGPWTFQVGGQLTVDAGASVVAPAVTSACKGSAVDWHVRGSRSTIGAAATFIGSLVANGDVALASGATVDGRIVALEGDVPLEASRVAACSNGRRFPAHRPIKVTGGGQLSVPDPDVADHRRGGRGRATFAFTAAPGVNGGPARGRFVYVNHVPRQPIPALGRMRVFGRVTDIDVMSVNNAGTPAQVRFNGTCTVRPDCTFSVVVEDRGEGRRDEDPDYDDERDEMVERDGRRGPSRPRDRMGVVIVSNGRIVEARALRPISRGNIQFHRPPGPALTTDLEDVEFGGGARMAVTASLDAVPSAARADAYIVLELPDGQLLSWTGSGFVPGIVPIARGIVPGPFEGTVAEITIPRGAPPGRYTWLSALTEAGTLNLLTPIAESVFTITP